MRVILTPPQGEFIRCQEKFPLFLGGFGSGKSHALYTKMIAEKKAYPRNDLALFAPSYGLIRDITIPRLTELLDNTRINFRLNKTDSTITFAIKAAGKVYKSMLLMRSMDDPSRIVGFEVKSSYVEELDTMSFKNADEAWNKIIARTRQKAHLIGGREPSLIPALNQVSVATTPEGFAFCHNRWVQKGGPKYVIIKAPTRTNPYLPEDYIESLYETYPENLIEAYLNGEFVNLESHNVYKAFNRSDNHTDRKIEEEDHLHIGLDFNVHNMNGIVHVLDLDEEGKKIPRAVEEITGLEDTAHMITTLNEKYSDYKVTLYPDASGKSSKSTDASKSDIQMLRAAGYSLKLPHSNPRIKDRVITMNVMFKDRHGNRRYLVNTNTCPQYTFALEKQVYDSNGLPEKNKADNIDDLNDSAGYFIHNMFHIDRPKFTTSTVRVY